MSDSEYKLSKIFFQLAGVSAIVLVCFPLASLILSALMKIDWSFISFVCILAGAGIVICSGLGGIIAIFEE